MTTRKEIYPRRFRKTKSSYSINILENRIYSIFIYQLHSHFKKRLAIANLCTTWLSSCNGCNPSSIQNVKMSTDAHKPSIGLS